MKRAARIGDAWHPVRPTFEYLNEARGDLDRYLEEAGRAPGSVEVAVKLPLIFQDDILTGIADNPAIDQRVE